MRTKSLPLAIVVTLLGATTALAKPATITITSKSPEAVATFLDARDKLDNVRVTEGVAGMQHAIALDPDFALAYAYLGSVTPGAEGTAALEKGVQLSAKLPEAERIEIQAQLDGGKGNELAFRSAWEKLAKLAPGDWHVHFALGQTYLGERKYDLAASSLKRATDLNPKAAAAFNSLGYVYLLQDRAEPAIATLKKYVALLPDDPNPYDSMAEAQMTAGHLQDAEASFQKAYDVSNEFYIALQGVSQTRFLRNDWQGGNAALDQAQAASKRAVDRLGLEFNRAWAQAAAGKLDDAMKTMDALDASSKAANEWGTYATVPVARTKMLVDAGKYDDAIASAATAMDRLQATQLPGGTAKFLNRTCMLNRMLAEARSGKLDAASQTLATIEADAKATPTNAGLANSVQLGRGEIALARGDAKAAVTALSSCIAQDTYAQWRLADAREKAGDKKGADQLRNKVLRTNRRDGEYLFVRSLMSNGQAVSGQD